MANADYERIPARSGLSEDLNVLAVTEAELEKATIQARQRIGSRSHADHNA